MGWPSAPLSRGPDGLEFWLQGTMLKVAPVSTKYLSLVNLSVKKIKPAFAGKCIAMAVACVGKAAEPKEVRWQLVFWPRTGRNALVSPIGIVIVKFTHAIARILKWMKIWGGRGLTFGAGITTLLSLLFLLLGAGLLLCCVEAAVTAGSWPPQASHRASAAFTMAAAVLWAPAPTVSLIDDGRWIKSIARKRSLSVDTPGGRCSHVNTGLEALHFHEKAKQFKVTLPLALAKLSKQSIFRKSNGSYDSLQTSRVSKMSWRTCLGRLARALAYLSFCDLIPAAANRASMRRNQISGSSSS